MNAPELHSSPPWNRPTKITVALSIVVFILLILWQFQTLIQPLIGAVILAYLCNPLIIFVHQRTGLSRNTSVLMIYGAITLAFLAGAIAFGVVLYRQTLNLIDTLPSMIASLPQRLEDAQSYLQQPVTVAGYTFESPLARENMTIDWNSIGQQLLGYAEPILSQVGTSLGQIAISTFEMLGWMVFILFVAIYISNDAPRVTGLIGDVATLPGYRQDAERLWRDFGRIWGAYLRGQLVLGLVIGVVVTVFLLILGVKNAFTLGLMFGILEFIPMIGPILGAVVAVFIAFFQEGNYFGLESWQFAGLVLAAMILVQQLENNFLVPRIVGDALDLHPLVVFVSALMGSSLAGILGVILAAPVVASIRLLGTYAWRKLFDLPPFEHAELNDEDQPSWLEQLWERWQLWRARAGQISPPSNKK